MSETDHRAAITYLLNNPPEDTDEERQAWHAEMLHHMMAIHEERGDE